MTARHAAAAALWLVAGGAAAAGEAPGWSLAPAVEQLRLDETDAGGRRLVREEGVLAGLRAAREQPAGDGLGWRLAATLAAGRVHYDGRTQGGAPAQSHTRSQLLQVEALLGWPVAAGWTAEAGIAGELFRRRIEGFGPAGGLDERLAQASAQVGASWQGGPWTLRLAARHGEPGPLEVRFDGGRFDAAALRSGRGAGLRLDVARTLAPGWRFGGGLERLALERSRPAVLRSGGAVVGTVVQPAWTRQRLWLLAEWSPR